MSNELLAGLGVLVAAAATFYVWLQTMKSPAVRKQIDNAKPAVEPKDAFARKIIRALGKRGYDDAYYDPASYAIRLGDGTTKPLAEAWAEVGDKSGTELDPFVEAFVLPWAGADPASIRDGFVTAVVAAFEAGGFAVVFDDDGFALNLGEDGMVFNLENAFRDYGRALDDEQRTQLLERYVAGAKVSSEKPESWDAVKDVVLPRVISESYLGWVMLHAATAAAKKGEKEIPVYPCATVGEGLILEVVLSDEVAIRPLGPLLADWDVSIEDALNTALRNFLASGEVPLGQVGENVFAPAWENHLEQNILLLPDEFWSQLPLEGAAVVWAFSNTATVVVGEDDPDACIKLVKAGKDILDSQRRLLPYPVIKGEDGHWHRWHPDPEDEDRVELQGLVASLLIADHNAQQEAIQDLLRLTGEGPPPFVGSLMGAGSADRAFTYAVWPPIPTVVPVADRVVVVGEDLMGVFVEWSDFVRLVGERLDPMPSLLPRRFHLDGPVSDEVWQEMLAVGESVGRVEPSWGPH